MIWFWTVSWFHAVSEGDYVSTSINRKWLWRIVSRDPIYTQKIDDLNVHFVPVTRYHCLVSNLRLTNTYLPCEQDFTNCNQFCTMWKNNNMWTYFHNEFFPIYQSNSNSSIKPMNPTPIGIETMDRFSIGHVFPVQCFERKGKWLQICTSHWLSLHIHSSGWLLC